MFHMKNLDRFRCFHTCFWFICCTDVFDHVFAIILIILLLHLLEHF